MKKVLAIALILCLAIVSAFAQGASETKTTAPDFSTLT